MKLYTVLSLVTILGLKVVPSLSQQVDCQADPSLCGRNSQCVESICQCDEGYSSEDGSDCLHDLCNIEDCYQCLDDRRCSRCKDIVVDGTGECISKCPHQESLQFHGDFVGRVCTYPSQTESLPTAYTAIIGVICAGIVIALIVGIACFFHQKRTQGNFDFLYGKPNRNKETTQADDNVTNQKYKRDPKNENSASQLPVKVDMKKTNPLYGNRDEFLRQVSELKPHAETFLKMLNDVRRRYRSLKHGNPRANTYKAVIRDLSRVLFILNKKESALKMPPDGNELLKWAARTLKNYENCQSVIKIETETNNKEKTGTKTAAIDTPGAVWIESKDDTSSLYKDMGYVESKLI